MEGELAELRHWAANNFEPTFDFWAQFADRVCRFGRGQPYQRDAKTYERLSRLYAEFETNGANIRAYESWM